MTREESDTHPLPDRLLKTGFLSRKDGYREGAGFSLLDDPEEIVRKLHLGIGRELEPLNISSLFPHDMNEGVPSDIEHVLEEFLQERRKLIRVIEYRSLSRACSMK
jgi:hypothetical protein